jgi:hypothetical protein
MVVDDLALRGPHGLAKMPMPESVRPMKAIGTDTLVPLTDVVDV